MGSKLLPDPLIAAFTFTGYGDSHIEINRQIWTQSVVLLSDTGPVPWAPRLAKDITAEDLAPVIASSAEVLIIGTGTRQVFLPRETMHRLQAGSLTQGIPRGIEVMSTPAACRTFNLLAAEGRRVLAAVLVQAQPPSEIAL
jgi:uncharacterized protein